MSDVNKKSKRWCFTINNPTEEDKETVERILSGGGENVRFFIAGDEIAPTTGTAHIQGYVEFGSRIRGTRVKSIVSGRACIFVAKGSAESNIAYCSKGGASKSFGSPEISNQGKRTDLEKIRKKIDEGAKIVDIARENFGSYCRNYKAFEKYRHLISEKRRWVTEVFVIIGKTGVGKTRGVVEKEQDLWIAPDNELKWFDGYDKHEAVLFDDIIGFKREQMSMLLKLCDRYPMDVPVKGGFINWCPRRIYFTSNIEFACWFGVDIPDVSVDAVKRRVVDMKELS